MNLLARRPDVVIDARDVHGLSPLATAGRDGRYKLIAHLLKLRRLKWDSKCARDHPRDHQALLLASQDGHWQCVDLILAKRSWAVGGLEFKTALSQASEESNRVLEGKIRALWGVNGGKAPWVHFHDTRAHM